jgi:hypothetical protein
MIEIPGLPVHLGVSGTTGKEFQGLGVGVRVGSKGEQVDGSQDRPIPRRKGISFSFPMMPSQRLFTGQESMDRI